MQIVLYDAIEVAYGGSFSNGPSLNQTVSKPASVRSSSSCIERTDSNSDCTGDDDMETDIGRDSTSSLQSGRLVLTDAFSTH